MATALSHSHLSCPPEKARPLEQLLILQPTTTILSLSQPPSLTMIRHRLKNYRESRLLEDRFLLPLRSTRGLKQGSAVWLLTSLALASLSLYCTWIFYPSSLETQRQIAVQLGSSHDNGKSLPARERSQSDQQIKRRIAWLMSFPNSVRNCQPDCLMLQMMEVI